MLKITKLTSNFTINTITIILIGFIFAQSINFVDFKYNNLNYSYALALAGLLMLLRTAAFVIFETQKHQSSKNWFGFGFDILVTIIQFSLLTSGIKLLANNSNPQNTVWFMLICSFLFFAQVYITKNFVFFKNCLLELAALSVATGLLRIINSDFLPTNQLNLFWVGISYFVFVIILYFYFNTIKLLFETSKK